MTDVKEMYWYTDESTRISQEILDNIDNFQVAYREEQYQEQLRDRFLYHKITERNNMSDNDFYKYMFNISEWYDQDKTIKTIKRLKETHERQELIEVMIEFQDDLHDEYIEYVTNVYMKD